MKCSFKNIKIYALLITLVMIIYGEGNPVDEGERFTAKRRKNVGRIRNSLINYYQSPEYINAELNESNGRNKKKFRFFGDYRMELQDQYQGKNAVKRQKVSLTHYPRKNSWKKEENRLHKQQNFHPANYDINRRKSYKPNLRNENGYDEKYKINHSTGNFKQRRDWFLQPKCNSDQDEVEFRGCNLNQPFSKKFQTDHLRPGTYMVQIDSVWEGENGNTDDNTKSVKRRESDNSRSFYIFEKEPFKVKFLSYLPNVSYEKCNSSSCTSTPSHQPSPSRESTPPCEPYSPCESSQLCESSSSEPSPCESAQTCKTTSPSPQSISTPIPNDISVKMTLPPFSCTPPECREVLYCKYFQCTSLGYFPDSRNCRKYFFCDINSNGLVLYHMLCPEGRIFDPYIRECRLREMMNEKDVRECRLEAAKTKRSQKMRIKKNDNEDLIKYKTQPKIKFRHGRMRNIVNYSPNERWKRRQLSKISDEELEKRRKIMMQKLEARKMLRQSNIADSWMSPKYRRKSFITIATKQPSCDNSSTTTFPSCCEILSTSTETSTIATTTEMPSLTTIETESTSTTPPTTKTSTATTAKTTVPVCPSPVKKKKPSQSCKKQKNDLGELESDAYQDDMQDYYYDNYYDGNYPENFRDSDYEWLRQGLSEYLDGIKLKKGKVDKEKKEKEKIESDERHSTTTQENVPGIMEDTKEEDPSKLSIDLTDLPLTDDSDRGKRSREKSSISPSTARQSESINRQDLPDFEQSYNEEKLSNLDGYPCKKYARYPDKFDNVCYYECGIQPDGSMKIEHKCCPKSEEFSPVFLECVATEYLKMAHGKRSAFEENTINGQRNQESMIHDDGEITFQNEWSDASQTDQPLPNEFKAKKKDSLRIYHLHCGQCTQSSNTTQSTQQTNTDKPNCPNNHKNEVRSFKIRNNKKEMMEESIKGTEAEEDEYDEEDYEEEDAYGEGNDDYEHETPPPKKESSTEEISSTKYTSSEVVSQLSTTSKVLLDADIHVGKDFENALKNILGNGQEKNQKRNSKDSILIRLSGNKPIRRRKRNFLKGTFFKKKDRGEIPEKERLVSMMTLINGLPSEYDRELLLQKLERRKMMNSHFLRVQRKRRKRMIKNP